MTCGSRKHSGGNGAGGESEPDSIQRVEKGSRIVDERKKIATLPTGSVSGSLPRKKKALSRATRVNVGESGVLDATERPHILILCRPRRVCKSAIHPGKRKGATSITINAPTHRRGASFLEKEKGQPSTPRTGEKVEKGVQTFKEGHNKRHYRPVRMLEELKGGRDLYGPLPKREGNSYWLSEVRKIINGKSATFLPYG